MPNPIPIERGLPKIKPNIIHCQDGMAKIKKNQSFF
jgi:hypothetical protein